MKQKTIYYKDELNDEFADDNIKPIPIGDNYIYVHKNIFKKFTHFFWYRIVAIPLAIIFLKLKYRHKKINKKTVRKNGKNGYFLYGNHTNQIPDALIPTMISMPKTTKVIVNSNNLAIPIIGKITPSLGALPLPDTRTAYKNFKNALKYHVDKKRCITIYPEAHIWPFYTKIRPFKADSFRYPIEYDKPTFCFTNVYQKRKFSKNPKMITYIDGPFYPNKDLSPKDQIQDLRNQIYNQMVLRSKQSNIEIIKYIKDSSRSLENE